MAASLENPSDVCRLTQLCAFISGVYTLTPQDLSLASISAELGKDLDTFLPEDTLFLILSQTRDFDELGIIVVLRIREHVPDKEQLRNLLYKATTYTNSYLLSELLHPTYKLDAHFNELLTICVNKKYEPECVKLLIRAGANVNHVNEGWPLIFMVVLNESVEHMHILLQHGANPNILNANGESIFKMAFSRSSKIMRVLLDYNIDTNTRDSDGCGILHHQYIDPDVMEQILERVTDVDCTEPKCNRTALHFAVASGCTRNVRALLDKGANIDARKQFDETPLHLAVNLHSTEIAELLLERGASVNATDHMHNTPLHIAADRGNQRAAILFMKHGAHVNAVNNEGMTPLHQAAYNDPMCTKVLIARGANVDSRNSDGETPLVCALHRSLTCFQILLNSGANVDIIFGNGNTLLHMAVRPCPGFYTQRRLKFLDMLLQADPDCSIVDRRGQTPLQIVQEQRDLPTIGLFRKYGKIPDEHNIVKSKQQTNTGTKKRKIEINTI